MPRFCWSFFILPYRRISVIKSTQTWAGRGTWANHAVTVNLWRLWSAHIFGHYVSHSQNPQTKPFFRAVMRQKCQPSCSFTKGSATMCLLNRQTIYCTMFLFIKKSARKHEGKKNMKAVFGQRGENVVRGDSVTPQYPFSAFRMEIERHLWEWHRDVFTKKCCGCAKIKLCLVLDLSFVLSTNSVSAAFYMQSSPHLAANENRRKNILVIFCSSHPHQ